MGDLNPLSRFVATFETFVRVSAVNSFESVEVEIMVPLVSYSLSNAKILLAYYTKFMYKSQLAFKFTSRVSGLVAFLDIMPFIIVLFTLT